MPIRAADDFLATGSDQMTIQGLYYTDSRPIALTVEDGIIAAINPCQGGKSLPFIAPGLVDLQINGLAGVDFNSGKLLPEEVLFAGKTLLSNGVTRFFPTLVTQSSEGLINAVSAIAEACDHSPWLNRALGGIHLEGPFISSLDGPRGAHNRNHIRNPDFSLIRLVQERSGGRLKIVTLAPERPGAFDCIRRCVAAGITVSIGHSAASEEEIEKAAACGATMSTHLGNGLSLQLPRHPNLIWKQLADPRLSAGFIADGFHLPPSFLRVLLKMKGDRAFMVSDATRFAGMAPGVYSASIGGSVRLGADGHLSMAERPELLAGSASLLPRQLFHLAASGLVSFAEAWDLASLAPARAASMEPYGLQMGAPADLVLFDLDEKEIRIRQVIFQGSGDIIP